MNSLINAIYLTAKLTLPEVEVPPLAVTPRANNPTKAIYRSQSQVL